MGDQPVRQTKEIFAEYSRMRDNGLDAKAALNVLRYHIEVLSKPDREALASMMRTREAGVPIASPVPAAPVVPTPPPAVSTPPAAAAAPISVPESSAPRSQKINSIKPLGNPANGNLSINDSLAEPAVTITPNVPIF